MENIKKVLFAFDFQSENPLNIMRAYVGSDVQLLDDLCGYRESIIPKLNELHPDILILTESLPGQQSIDSILYNIKVNHSYCRVILIAGPHVYGDEFLKAVIGRGVYDITCGDTKDLKLVADMIYHKREYKDIVKYLGEEEEESVSDTEIRENLPVVLTVNKEELPKKNIFRKIFVQKQNNMPVYKSNELNLMNRNVQASENFSNVVSEPVKIPKVESDELPTQMIKPAEIICTPEPVFKEMVPAQRGFVFSLVNNSNGIDIVLNNQVYKRAKVISFASSRTGAGTTTAAINTAIALAQKTNKRVLLVDANIWNQDLLKKISLPNNNIGFGLDNAVKTFLMNKQNSLYISSIPSNYNKIAFSQNVDYMAYSNKYAYSQYDDLSRYLKQLIESDRFYDYIVVDLNLSGRDVHTDIFLELSSAICLCSPCDYQIIEELYYNRRKALIDKIPLKIALLTRSPQNSEILQYFSSTLSCRYGAAILDDVNGFYEASCSKIPYISCGKKKVYKTFFEVANILK